LVRMAGFRLVLLTLVLSTSALAQGPAPFRASDGSVPDANARDVLSRVIDGVKEAERAQYLYERIERVETRKDSGDKDPQKAWVSRVVPAGTGIAKINLGLDGKPVDPDYYRSELDRVLKSLTWAAQNGPQQRDAYLKVQKKQKDRDELIEATRNAFIFTFVGSEPRGDRTLLKYRMEPNPNFKATNRATSIYGKVKGFVWVDEATHQMARVQGEVTDDISLGLFLAKIYKGSKFLQDRYEIAPGLWLPSFSQYDFDGRKFFSSISIHEKTFYNDYKRVGPPAEAIPRIQSEIAQIDAMKAKPAADR
jgi:hypothetical protein